MAMLIAAILMGEKIEHASASPEEVERYLEHELEARVGAVLEWDHGRRAEVERIADEPALRAALERALRDRDGSQGARSTELGALLADLCADLKACTVARADGSVLAAHRDRAVPADLVRRAARGRTVSSPLVSRGTEEPFHGPIYSVFFATPIVAEGEVRGVVVGRVHPDEELAPILGDRPPGRTGETYAVDPRGFMVTRSRFDARRHRAPTREAWPAGAGAPLPAVAALDRSGSDVRGYLDYRGVRVVGAWRWIDELGAGVVTEMDVVEAFQLGAQ